MNVKAERERIIKELKQVEDISLLKTLRLMIQYGLKKEGRISIEQYNRELDEAEAEVRRGASITHEELKRQAAKW